MVSRGGEATHDVTNVDVYRHLVTHREGVAPDSRSGRRSLKNHVVRVIRGKGEIHACIIHVCKLIQVNILNDVKMSRYMSKIGHQRHIMTPLQRFSIFAPAKNVDST